MGQNQPLHLDLGPPFLPKPPMVEKSFSSRGEILAVSRATPGTGQTHKHTNFPTPQAEKRTHQGSKQPSTPGLLTPEAPRAERGVSNGGKILAVSRAALGTCQAHSHTYLSTPHAEKGTHCDTRVSTH
jgi:hypothetical protein